MLVCDIVSKTNIFSTLSDIARNFSWGGKILKLFKIIMDYIKYTSIYVPSNKKFSKQK